jgi:hypothetical protein
VEQATLDQIHLLYGCRNFIMPTFRFVHDNFLICTRRCLVKLKFDTNPNYTNETTHSRYYSGQCVAQKIQIYLVYQ